MGQSCCSGNKAAEERTTTAKSGKDSTSSELVDLHEYMGRCWLIAADATSFSPSRWFPLCERTVSKCPIDCRSRPCFSLAPPRQLSAAQRRKDPKLEVLASTRVPPGLTLSPYERVGIALFTQEELQGKSSVTVQSAHVDVSDLATEPSLQFVCLVVVMRLDVEMTPTQYAIAPYTRHRVKAPPTNAEERLAYGEGCITGMRYGGVAILRADSPGIATALHERLHHTLTPRGAEVRLQSPQTPPEATRTDPDGPAASGVIVDIRGGQQHTGAAILSNGDSTSVDAVATWVTNLYSSPALWVPIGLFLQRYEAIGECLLKA